MGNVVDYVKQYGDQDFSERLFGEADVLVMAMLSYMSFDGLVPTPAEHKDAVTLAQIDESMDPAKVFENKMYVKRSQSLWNALRGTRRFWNMGCNFCRTRLEEEETMQFSAITFFPQGSLPVVVFRGTDETIVGWKEDFHLAFSRPVEAQRMSALYLTQVSSLMQGNYVVCGHSKGGNLAVYSAIWADPFARGQVEAVYSLDGPGFLPELIEEKAYEEIRGRVHRILPTSSMVGMLLQNYESYEVVKSSAFGMMQHDGYSWQIEDGVFVRAEEIQSKRKRMDEVLNRWIFAMPEQERELFVDSLFGMIEKTGASTLTEFAADWKKNLRICAQHMRGLDPETRKRFRQILRMFLEIYRSVMETAVKQEFAELTRPAEE